jgi:hypothetical protein
MARGAVKWFDPNRGDGVIRPEQGQEVFRAPQCGAGQRAADLGGGPGRGELLPGQVGAARSAKASLSTTQAHPNAQASAWRWLGVGSMG